MSQKYPWAVNQVKLERAVKAAGEKGTEKQVKALYVSYAGLVKEVDKKKKRK